MVLSSWTLLERCCSHDFKSHVCQGMNAHTPEEEDEDSEYPCLVDDSNHTHEKSNEKEEYDEESEGEDGPVQILTQDFFVQLLSLFLPAYLCMH